MKNVMVYINSLTLYTLFYIGQVYEITAAARGKANPLHNRLCRRAKTGRPTTLTFKRWVQPKDEYLNSLVKDGKAHCPRSRNLPTLRTAGLLGAGILLLLTGDQSPILPCAICDLKISPHKFGIGFRCSEVLVMTEEENLMRVTLVFTVEKFLDSLSAFFRKLHKVFCQTSYFCLDF